ncbi:Chitinase 4 [Linum grandiflorum]
MQEAGKANGFDGVANPDVVARDPVLAWRTALWFWMTNVRAVLPQGFGATIRKINSIECNGGNTPAVNARVNYYSQYCQQLGIGVDANARC